MDRRGRWIKRLHLDPPLIMMLMLLCAVGLVVLYSAGGQNMDLVVRQGIRMAVGFVLMLAVAQLSPDKLARWAPGIYAAALVLLVGVLLFGDVGKGARRWIDLGLLRFQPSELMKLGVPLMMAWFLRDKAQPPDLLRILVVGVLVAMPVVLVARQPDLGTAALIAAAGFFVLFLAGISWRFLGAAGIIALVSAPLLWFSMHDYQRRRVLTFFDPEKDPLGAGYHIIQSQIAVGSGGLYGKGWLNGTQSHLEFLPERSTDFIFAVFCEEFGFFSVLALLAAYLFLVGRGLYIAAEAQGTFARLLAGSLTLTFFIYVFVNVGMVIGQLPVVGVPLPLISYGGTSLVTLMVGFGILMSIHTHKRMLSN